MEIILISYLFIWLVTCQDSFGAQSPQDCYSGQTIGANRKIASGGEQFTRNEQPDSTVIILDTGTGQGSDPISGDTSFTSECCGIVKQWGVDAQNYPGGKVKLQVWRPQGNNRYMLVGEEDFPFTQAKNGPSYVDSTDDILIQVGDKLGFTGDLLEYKKSNGYDGILSGTVMRADGLGGAAGPVVQSTYTLDTEHVDADDNTTPEMIGWAFDAILKKRDTNPGCAITFTKASFDEDVPVGTMLGTIAKTSVGDDTITDYQFALTSVGGINVAVDPTTGVITTAGKLTASPPTQTFTVSGKIIEDICFKYGVCSADIVINWINQPITITNLPATDHLVESTEAATPIFLIETDDDNRKSFVDRNPTCSVTHTLPAMPTGTGFSTTANFISTKFNLQYDGKPALNALTLPVIRVVIECKDEYGTTATGTFTLSVDKNSPPTVTNPPDASGKICGSANAMNIRQFDPVFYLGITDTEGDSIQATLKKKNPDSPFAWDAANNAIYATKDLATILVPYHEFTLEITDKWNPNTPSTYTICINLTGLNSVPVFSNCPKTIPMAENTDAGSVLFTAGVTDANKQLDHQVHTFSMNVKPLVFEPSFTLDTMTGDVIVTGNGIGDDYEQAEAVLNGGKVEFEIAVTDGIHYATQPCILYLQITNVNDPPVLAAETLEITTDEGQLVDAALPSLNMKFVDEDAGQKHDFEILSGNTDDYLKIDTKTGQLSFAKDCNREMACPTKFELIIEIKDSGGLTDTVAVTVNILDVNDNAPKFSATNCDLTITNTTETTAVLATLTATDPDEGQNGLFSYSIVGIGYGSQYFRIDSTGKIRLRKKMNFKDAVTFTITVSAKDRGNPPLETYVHCKITYPLNKTAGPVNVDKAQPCFFCTEGGVAIFTLFMVAVAIVAALIFYMLWNRCLREPLLRLYKSILGPRKPQLFRRQRIREEFPRPPPSPIPERQPQQEEPVIPIKRKIRTPPAPAQTVRFGYWNEGDKELDGKNPRPSDTYHPF